MNEVSVKASASEGAVCPTLHDEFGRGRVADGLAGDVARVGQKAVLDLETAHAARRRDVVLLTLGDLLVLDEPPTGENQN